MAIGGDDARRRLQGCSLFGLNKWEDKTGSKRKRQYGYSLSQLQVSPDGQATLRIWPRVASDKQNRGWEFDPDTSFSPPKGQEATKWMPIKLLRSPSPNVGAIEKLHVPDPFSPTSGGMSRPAHQILPITDTAFFTGRETQLDQLCDRLLRAEGTPERPLLAGIWGPPGAGKSALAAVFAERMAEHFPDRILTVDVRTNPTPEAIAYHFASLIGIPVNPNHEGRWEAAEIMQSRFAMRPCLLILDNADEGTFREISIHTDDLRCW
ncbi:MAG: hypothetical protein M3255_10525 [Pseudomonadota bacterium]|nr:hypothetical protein [Pseudomonadota bacterium]